MKKFFAKNKKQSPCLISPKDFKKYRKSLKFFLVIAKVLCYSSVANL